VTSTTRAIPALLWIASFSLGILAFLAASPLLRLFPATPPVAVGIVTIEHASKARDYAAPLLFFLIVPAVTIATHRRMTVEDRQSFPSQGQARSPVLHASIVYLVIPLLAFCLTYAVLARATPWIDLFHRGEVLGPASDYLRGKAPYREVFALHGLLVDGQLDAWLMHVFGRDAGVSLIRRDIFSALASPALWYLSIVVFESIPLALATMLLGVLTAADNERVLFEIIAVALLIAGVRGGVRRSLLFFSGVAAALALFFSLDTGLYSITGALLFLIVAGLMRQEVAVWPFVAGVAAGALPFLVYLASRGALLDFIDVSFITIPRIIDATWSIPFPDLRRMRFVAQIRYVLGPVVTSVALIALVERFLRKRFDTFDTALLALTAFAIPTLRSAMGRADIQHQVFSSFLLAPMIVMLVWRAAGIKAAAVLVVLAAAFWAPDAIRFRFERMATFAQRMKGETRDPIAADVDARISGLRTAVDHMIGKDDPVFDFSNQPGLYFFLDRPNPTRFYQVPILSPPDFQLEAILGLEKTKTAVVIRRSPQGSDAFDGVDNDDRAQAVAAYIDDKYRFAQDVRGVELWMRRPDGGQFDIAKYMRAIHMPSVTDLVIPGPRPRIEFPSVRPVDDLTIRNPSRRPIRLNLRYANVDRRITIPAGLTVQYSYAGESLFQITNGPAPLSIEYRQGVRPLASITLRR
jgi:hypothetical protein